MQLIRQLDLPAPRLLGWTLLAASAPATWGTTYFVTTEYLPDGPLFAALMRSLPVGLLGLLIVRKLPSGRWWWRMGLLGALNIGAFFPLLFVAAERLPGGVAGTLIAAQPVFVAVLTVPLLSEKLSRWRLGWGVVGVLGVGLVVIGPDAALDPLGICAGLLAAVAMGTGLVLTKRWGSMPNVGSLTIASWQLTAGGLVLLAPTLLFEGVPSRIDARAVGGYLWLAIPGALVTYTFLFAGIRRIPVTAASLLGILSPLVAATLGVLVAGEELTVFQVAGFAVALSAMASGQLTGRRRSTGPARELEAVR